MPINVTRPALPDLNKYLQYLTGIWERGQLTNRGPLVLELEQNLQQYLGLDHLLFVGNGTIAIQVAIKAMNLKGSILTTPFSYVATTTSIIWENCRPIFVDIEPATFCLNPDLIESRIEKDTTAILATHVYGFPCDVEKIDRIAKRNNLRVIYDAAHAFGVRYKDKSILSYGDVSTLSFHATKLFHTVEGGAIVSNDSSLRQIIFSLHAFGHLGDEYYSMGVNAKNSEFHAAMGLCNLPLIKDAVSRREKISDIYKSHLNKTAIEFPKTPAETEYNFAYFPIIFKSESGLLSVKKALESQGINTRRYFYPSLNKLPYLNNEEICSVSEDISRRVLCLPFYQQLTDQEIESICLIINNTLQQLAK